MPVYEELNKLCEGDFHLICSSKQTSELVQSKLKITLHENVSILDNNKSFFIGNKSTTFANRCIEIKWQPGLYDEIKKINPDTIIVEGFGSWSPAGILYSILYRKKLCMFYERTAYVERNAKFVSKLYRKLVGKFVDCFLVNGDLTENYLRNCLGFRKTKIIKGCMAADSKGLANSVAKVTEEEIHVIKQECDLKEGLTYLFVGQIVKRKGVIELVEAWKLHIVKHPDDNLLIIGKGVLYDELLQKSAGYDSIHVLGAISYDNIHRYYALCDVFFMPTLEDNWCLVLPEAMSCGKPVACSIYNGGTCELIKDGVNGYSFDPHKSDDIIEKLDLFHSSNLSEMGKKSKEIEAAFTPTKSAIKIFSGC